MLFWENEEIFCKRKFITTYILSIAWCLLQYIGHICVLQHRIYMSHESDDVTAMMCVWCVVTHYRNCASPIVMENSCNMCYFSLYSIKIYVLLIKARLVSIKWNSFFQLSLLWLECFLEYGYSSYIPFLVDSTLIIVYKCVVYTNYSFYLIIYHLFTSQIDCLNW